MINPSTTVAELGYGPYGIPYCNNGMAVTAVPLRGRGVRAAQRAGGTQGPGGDSAEFSAAVTRILNDMEIAERKALSENVGQVNGNRSEGLDIAQTLNSLSPSERRRIAPLLFGMQGAPVRRMNAAGNTISPDTTKARLSYMEKRHRQAIGG